MYAKNIHYITRLYGAFAIERPKKIKIELMSNLDLFQPKNHIWHININLIFFGVCFLSIAKALYGYFTVEREETTKKIKNELILNLNQSQLFKYNWHIN